MKTELLANLETSEQRVSLVYQEQLDSRESPVHKEIRVPRVMRVSKDPLDLKDPKETRANVDQPELSGPKVTPERLVLKV